MTVLVVRSPLQTLSMASTQRQATRRRSARRAFDEIAAAEEDHHQHIDAPPAKRARKDATAEVVNGTGTGKQTNGTAGKAAGLKTRAGEWLP